MPLIHDPEYDAALVHFAANVRKGSRKVLAKHSLLCVGLGICVFFLANSLSGGELVVASAVLCTAVLVYVLNIAMSILWLNLVIISATIEWVGKKQLREYEPPD